MAVTEKSWGEQARVLAGARLKRVRMQQGLSIRQISEVAKISKTSVVQVETGRSSRRSTYLKLATALGLHLENLLQSGIADGLPYMVHHNQDDQWYDLARFDEGRLPEAAQSDPAERQKLVGATPLNILKSRLEQGRIKPTIIEVSSPSERRAHAGEEFVYVIQGTAILAIGEHEITLNTGESVTFWSEEPHSYQPHPDSKMPVRLLSVRVDT